MFVSVSLRLLTIARMATPGKSELSFGLSPELAALREKPASNLRFFLDIEHMFDIVRGPQNGSG